MLNREPSFFMGCSGRSAADGAWHQDDIDFKKIRFC